jgi:hypothetical protein
MPNWFVPLVIAVDVRGSRDRHLRASHGLRNLGADTAPIEAPLGRTVTPVHRDGLQTIEPFRTVPR